jgi:c-di-GMP-binding flagellar brake protein YcgR
MHKKRRHKRVPISASVTITCEGQRGQETYHSMAGNISLSGIGLYSDSPLEPETDVSLAVHFISKNGGIATDAIGGSVVYVKEIGGMYFMGVEFGEEVNKGGQPFLYEHLMSILTAD